MGESSLKGKVVVPLIALLGIFLVIWWKARSTGGEESSTQESGSEPNTSVTSVNPRKNTGPRGTNGRVLPDAAAEVRTFVHESGTVVRDHRPEGSPPIEVVLPTPKYEMPEQTSIDTYNLVRPSIRECMDQHQSAITGTVQNQIDIAVVEGEAKVIGASVNGGFPQTKLRSIPNVSKEKAWASGSMPIEQATLKAIPSTSLFAFD